MTSREEKNMPNRLLYYVLVALFMLFVANACKSVPNAVDVNSVDTNQGNVVRISTATSIAKSNQADSSKRKITQIEAKWGKNYKFAELTYYADLIVEGTITRILETRLLPPTESPVIFTDYQLNISKLLKSPPGFALDSVTVVQPGGSNGSVTQIYKGNEPFELGEQVVLFLKDVSDDPVHTSEGEVKYSVLMNGGRFKFDVTGILSSAAQGNSVAEKYRNKNKAILENDVLASLPDKSVYIRQALGAFLIVEGTIGKPTSRLVVQEDTQSVFTVYPFRVEHVIYDALVQAQNLPRKPNLYDHTPVNEGDLITIFERGGTYENITQRWAWSWGMSPKSRMLLFLGAFDCGNKPDVCTQQEMNNKKAMYFAGGGERFLITEDNTLSTVTRTFFSQLYDGKPKEQLERDLVEARMKLDVENEAKKNQPSQPSDMPTPPLPTIIPTPEP